MNVVRAKTEVDYDLDHVALYSSDPEATAREYLSLGFNEAEPRDGVPRVELGGACSSSTPEIRRNPSNRS